MNNNPKYTKKQNDVIKIVGDEMIKPRSSTEQSINKIKTQVKLIFFFHSFVSFVQQNRHSVNETGHDIISWQLCLFLFRELILNSLTEHAIP